MCARALVVPVVAVLAACATRPPAAPADPDDVVPALRLPADVRPTGQTIRLFVDPRRDRFEGETDIAVRLERPRRVVWLHGKGLRVSRAAAVRDGTPVPATWRQRDDTGFVSLALERPLAGAATLHVEFDAPFGTTLDGLHKVAVGPDAYAFTQFESISARQAFPCFDEPGIKIPFELELRTPPEMQAIANTREVGRREDADAATHRYAPTPPLPSYLVAFAVGPLDVVAAPDVPPSAVRTRPLPLRGVATRGRGPELKYALAHAGEIVSTLETYFGVEYPYDKLDLIAVPDKGGAMENPGAVTFAEWLLLFDGEKAPLDQRRAYAGVVAHELAHIWFGDLVTMAWWDDLWLNEAFATWMGARAADEWDPRTDARMHLLAAVQDAMGTDALVSARKIRQPIESVHDIENAFDSITYQKGGGVLSMFERWIGPEAFRDGVRRYLAAHRFGAATADDFLGALSAAAGRDVGGAFRTFLDQPGVPFVAAETRCDGAPRLHLVQSRYLPLGSAGDPAQAWKLPVCARYRAAGQEKEACTLLVEKEGDLALGSVCPEWVFPNADASGYFRFALAPADLARVRTGALASLPSRERVAYGNSLRAAFNRATTPMKDLFVAAEPLASDPHREVALEPIGFVESAREWLFDDPLRASVEAYGRRLFREPWRALGWEPRPDDDENRIGLRTTVLRFLALEVRDQEVRAEARKRALAYLGIGADGALHAEAVDGNLRGAVLRVAGEEADRGLWDVLHSLLPKTQEGLRRRELIAALASARAPDLREAACSLSLEADLRASETTMALWVGVSEPDTRESTWTWMKAHFDAVAARLPTHGATQLIAMGGQFCDEAHARDVEAFFAKRAGTVEGGPRVLAETLESVRLCVARRTAQEPGAREFFGRMKDEG